MSAGGGSCSLMGGEARGQVRPGLCKAHRLDRVAAGCHMQVLQPGENGDLAPASYWAGARRAAVLTRRGLSPQWPACRMLGPGCTKASGLSGGF